MTETGEMVATAPVKRRRKIDKSLLIVSLVIAAGIVLVGRGLAVGITGDSRDGLPEYIEDIDPVPDAVQVLSQTRVFVDLVAGYTGVIVIDGVEIPTKDVADYVAEDAEPGSQVNLPPDTIYERGNATLTFVPSDAAPITRFETGAHHAQVIFWKLDESRQQSRSYSWTFTVV